MLYRGRGKAYPEPDKGLERQSDWIYAVFSCSDIQKSADPGCFFVLFIVLPDRLYIWELICLPCTKSTRILDMRGNFFSICPNASYTGRAAAICVRRTGICARAGGSWRPKRLVSSLVFRVTRGILY